MLIISSIVLFFLLLADCSDGYIPEYIRDETCYVDQFALHEEMYCYPAALLVNAVCSLPDTNTLKLAGHALRGFRVSCQSDPYSSHANMAGMIVYHRGSYPKRIWPGYVIIYNSDNLSTYKSNEGIVHGKVARRYFGMEPSQLKRDYGMTFGGFSIIKGKFKYNSGTFNTGDRYHDSNRAMSSGEQCLLNDFLRDWVAAGRGQAAYTLKDLGPLLSHCADHFVTCRD